MVIIRAKYIGIGPWGLYYAFYGIVGWAVSFYQLSVAFGNSLVVNLASEMILASFFQLLLASMGLVVALEQHQCRTERGGSFQQLVVASQQFEIAFETALGSLFQLFQASVGFIVVLGQHQCKTELGGGFQQLLIALQQIELASEMALVTFFQLFQLQQCSWLSDGISLVESVVG